MYFVCSEGLVSCHKKEKEKREREREMERRVREISRKFYNNNIII